VVFVGRAEALPFRAEFIGGVEALRFRVEFIGRVEALRFYREARTFSAPSEASR
jgi:hypothetical protein